MQRQTRLKHREIEELVVQYSSGSTVYELATLFGCHRNTVSRLLKSRGVSMRLSPLTTEQIERAVELYSSGLSLLKVAHMLGVSAGTVHARLRDHGVTLRDSHGRQRT